MYEWLPTLVYAPLLAASLWFADEGMRVALAQEVAAAAAFRGARAAAACVDADGRIESDLDTRVRRAAAVTLLPDARFAGPAGRTDGSTARAVAALAREAEVSLPGYTDLAEALEVTVEGPRGRLRPGDRWEGGAVTVRVIWAHPLRPTPVAAALAEGTVAGSAVAYVEASSTVWVDPPRTAP